MVAKHVSKKKKHANHVGKPRVLTNNALLHSVAALAATFRAVAFILIPFTLIMIQSHRQSEFCANFTPAGRVASLGGSPHQSCKRDQIKGKAGYLTYLGFPTSMFQTD